MSRGVKERRTVRRRAQRMMLVREMEVRRATKALRMKVGRAMDVRVRRA